MGKKNTTSKIAPAAPNGTASTTNENAPAKGEAALPAVSNHPNGDTSKDHGPLGTPKRIARAAAAKGADAGKGVDPQRATEKPLENLSASLNQQEIALRAYFIAEKRRALSLPGDEHQDWLEAERQLLAGNSARNTSRKSE